MPTGYNFGFEVCRVCLSPDEVTKLTSVFAGDGSIGRKFQEISGVDVSSKFYFFNCSNNFFYIPSDILGLSRRRPDLQSMLSRGHQII